ncbi:MAG: response regulator [Gammaproteobacteria bacterium]
MNSPQIKKALFVIGIVPVLLTSLLQIGYLNYRPIAANQGSSTQSQVSRQSTANAQSSRPKARLPEEHSQHRSLILASVLIGLTGLLSAGFIANYFSRRLIASPKKPDTGSTAAKIASQSSPASKLAEAQPSVSNRTAAKTETPSTFSVFIADDNNINRLLLSNQLEGRCQKTTIAKDGTEALQFLTSERFDLIFLDLQMPGHTGLDLIKKIKQAQCINRNTPVIAITAHAQLSQRKKIIAEGFDECLIKPILTEQLDEIIDLWRPLSNQQHSALKQKYSQQILNKTCQNHELASTIAKKLFEELPQQLRLIEIALKNRHAELALEITHKLHGSVSFCGLTDIQKPAYALEQNLLNNDYDEANRTFYKLRDASQEFIESERTTLVELVEESAYK